MHFSLKKLNTEAILLAVGIVLLVSHNYVFTIPSSVQMIILLTLVFVIGVPHGALDFLVDEQNEVLKNNNFSIKKFVVIYVSRLLIFSVFWLLPWLAFTLFILFSIFHFGETDMASIMKPNKTSNSLFIAYGSFILSLLLLTHLNEIVTTLPIMGEYIKDNAIFLLLIKYAYPILFIVGFLFLIILFIQIKKGNTIKLEYAKVLQFVILIGIVATLPMLLAFTFYFALWHSILSIKNIFSYFKRNNNESNFSLICNKSILFSALALGSIVGLYFILDYFMPNMNMLFALLIVLSVLTLPHLKVMHSMYLNNQQVSEA